MTKEHNGWNTYETWRINNDILSDITFSETVTISDLKEIVEDCVFRNPNTCDTPYLVEAYARAFISSVDWEELVDTINDDIKTI